MSRGRDNAPRLRYIYHDEPIRCFDSKDEAERYARIHLSSPSNPDFRWFRHAISILVTWEQVKLYLVNYRFDRRTLPRALVPEVPRGSIKDNPFFIHREKRNPSDERDRIYGAIAEQIIQRLELPFYRELSENSITNMLQYLFYHMRCGIFVSIKNNRLHMFVPFANNNYKNNWKGKGRFDEWSQGMDLKRYYEEKEEIFRRENVLPIEQWWANGNIICNEKPKKVWGDHLLVPLRDMLIATCKSREVPDVDFFINKRDFPHLKSNLTEPYDFIFDQKDLPLSDFRFETYAPIVSFFCSPEFADLPFPSADDWEIVTGKVFPPKGGENYSISKMTLYQVDWNKKIPTAFWRGSATGGGITPETNQRLKVSELSSSWNDDEQYNDKNSIDGFHFLDAGVTTWNIRDKKLFSEPMTYLNPERLSFSSAPFVPMYEQAKYKYIVYVEGHCAAARYLFLMSLGCVILRVKSTCVASELWFFPILSAWDDHVPVDSDLSNLAECIAWCKTHDEECRKIAERSRFLFTQYFSRSNVLDYLQFIMFEISARFNAKNSSNGVKRASEMDSVESSNKRRKVNDEFFGIGSPISLEERKSLKILDHASNYLVKQLTTSNIGDVSLQFFLAHAPDGKSFFFLI